MLKQFIAGQVRYGFIEGERGYIVTETDFCHNAYRLKEPVVLQADHDGDKYQIFSLEGIRAVAQPVTSYLEWAHYWGIKGRIKQNYNTLIQTMKSIGADTSNMPEWGKEPSAVEPVSPSSAQQAESGI